mgnify:CR=1 FL=1
MARHSVVVLKMCAHDGGAYASFPSATLSAHPMPWCFAPPEPPPYDEAACLPEGLLARYAVWGSHASIGRDQPPVLTLLGREGGSSLLRVGIMVRRCRALAAGCRRGARATHRVFRKHWLGAANAFVREDHIFLSLRLIEQPCWGGEGGARRAAIFVYAFSTATTRAQATRTAAAELAAQFLKSPEYSEGEGSPGGERAEAPNGDVDAS